MEDVSGERSPASSTRSPTLRADHSNQHVQGGCGGRARGLRGRSAPRCPRPTHALAALTGLAARRHTIRACPSGTPRNPQRRSRLSEGARTRCPRVAPTADGAASFSEPRSRRTRSGIMPRRPNASRRRRPHPSRAPPSGAAALPLRAGRSGCVTPPPPPLLLLCVAGRRYKLEKAQESVRQDSRTIKVRQRVCAAARGGRGGAVRTRIRRPRRRTRRSTRAPRKSSRACSSSRSCVTRRRRRGSPVRHPRLRASPAPHTRRARM
jgi:hypothetical protein